MASKICKKLIIKYVVYQMTNEGSKDLQIKSNQIMFGKVTFLFIHHFWLSVPKEVTSAWGDTILKTNKQTSKKNYFISGGKYMLDQHLPKLVDAEKVEMYPVSPQALQIEDMIFWERHTKESMKFLSRFFISANNVFFIICFPFPLSTFLILSFSSL